MDQKPRKLKRYYSIIAIAIILLILICVDSARDKVLWRFISGGHEAGEGGVLTPSGDMEEAGQRNSKRKRVKTEKKHPFEVLRQAEVRLLDDSAIVTEDAARYLELTKSERILTQEVIDKNFEEMRALLAPTVMSSNSDKKTYLSIPALKDRGNREIEKFQNDLAAVIREEKTKKVMLSLPIDEYYGGFGQFDISICVTSRFSHDLAIRSKSDLVLIEYKNPDTGKLMVRVSTTWDRVGAWMPKLFDLSAE